MFLVPVYSLKVKKMVQQGKVSTRRLRAAKELLQYLFLIVM